MASKPSGLGCCGPLVWLFLVIPLACFAACSACSAGVVHGVRSPVKAPQATPEAVPELTLIPWPDQKKKAREPAPKPSAPPKNPAPLKTFQPMDP